MDSLKDKTIKGFFWTGSAQAVTQVVSYVVSIILARLLMPSDYGLMAMALIFMQLFQHFREISLGGAIVQKKETDAFAESSAFWFLCLTGAGTYLLIYILSDYFGIFFGEEGLSEILKVLGLSLILSSLFSVPISLLSKELEFKKVATVKLVSTLMMGAVSVLFAYEGFGVWSLVFGSLTNVLFLTFLSFSYAKWRPKFTFSIEKIKPLLRFGIPMTGSKFLTYVLQNADYFIVGKFLGGQLLGFYYMAFNLSTKPISQLSTIISEVNFPVFSKIQDSADESKKYFFKSTTYVSLIVFPALIGLFLVADGFVETVLGEKWLPMVLSFKILSIAGIFRSMQFVISPLLYGMGRADTMFKFSLVSSIVLVFAFTVGVRFGIEGVAFAWLLIYPPLYGYLLSLCLREMNLKLSEYIKCFKPAFGGTAVMTTAVILTQMIPISNGIFRLIALILSGVISYLLFISFRYKDISLEIKDIISSLRLKKTHV